MDYEKFVENVQADLIKSLSDSCHNVTVEPIEVSKLQGQSYSGVSIKHDDSAISTSVNLEQFYGMYQDGSSYENVLQEIADAVVTGFASVPDVDIGMLSDYESMKQHLTAQIVGAKNNSDKLKDVPHQMMEDMAVVYRFQVGEVSSGQASILITNQMLELYGITQEQLHQDALEMSQRNEPVSIKNMDEIIYEMSDGFMGSIENPESALWVATNESRFNGASVIAYPDFMERAAQQLDGGFYLLPSSIHETLLISDAFGMKAKELKEMVTQINAAEIRPEEKLTDNAYHYDADAKVFEQAENFEKRMEKAQEHKSVLDELKANKQICKETEPKSHKAPKKDVPEL